MLWTILLVLVIAWALKLVSGYTLGHFIHVLLVIALVVLVFQPLAAGDRAPESLAGRARRWTRRRLSEVLKRFRSRGTGET